MLYIGYYDPFEPQNPKKVRMHVNTGQAKDLKCMTGNVLCNSDDDCAGCEENFEMKCQTVKSAKFCLPVKPTTGCNSQFGGEWLWSGDTATETMGWSCFCSQSMYYNGYDCSLKNSTTCQGGTLSSLTPQGCTCPNGTTRVLSKYGVVECLAGDVSMYDDYTKF